jgi:hypothetical protein
MEIASSTLNHCNYNQVLDKKNKLVTCYLYIVYNEKCSQCKRNQLLNGISRGYIKVVSDNSETR